MAEDVFDPSSGSEFDDDTDSSARQPDGDKSADKGRSLDNVRGEMARKHDELKGQVASLTEAVQKLATAFTQRQPDAKPTPPPQQRPMVSPYGAPNPDINEYTDEQLQQALGSGRLDPYQVRVIESLLSERRIERKTKELFEQRDKQQFLTKAQSEARDAAMARFPAYRDPTSEFSQRVQAAIKARQSMFGVHPHDELDVANEVAQSMRIEPSRVVQPLGYVGRPEGGDKVASEEDDAPMSDDEIAEIANNLRYAMPLRRNPETGKMERKKFNLKRIKERSKRYQENSPLYKSGRKVKGSSR